MLCRSWDDADKVRIGDVRLLITVADEDDHAFSSAVERLAASGTLGACGLAVPI